MTFDIKRNITLFTLLLSTILLFTINHNVYAECESSLKLEGSLSIKCCDPGEDCIPAGQAVYDYSEEGDDDPTVLSIGLQSSPWRLYDGEMRIITVEELAEIIKPNLHDPVKSVLLVASWTGVAPEKYGKSIAEKLSLLLGGFPVTGTNGFVWLDKDGGYRTTHQAFTMKQKCPYGVSPGEDVMVSLAAGWHVEFEQHYIENKDAMGLLFAGAGWDIYHLCPEKALDRFEASAALSNPIAAYNAALIHLELGTDDDLDKAKILLKIAADLGDKKAQKRLQELSSKHQ